MRLLSAERWREVSPHLDRALEMPEEERRSWLDGMRITDAQLVEDLETLLDERSRASREGFLAVSPIGSPPASLAGQAIGSYTLISLLGQGGMGNVWLARRSDGRFEGMAAVKLLNASLVGRAGAERFRREGQILARLADPHIARLLDAGVSPSGQPFLVLEHVEGEPIDAYCDHQRLGIEARLRLFLGVLDAVALAHTNLIVHRDIKPSNVLVDKNGEAKLLDFGIAKLLEGEGEAGAATDITRDAGRALTPQFAAPEQISGGAITTATDVYTLGILLYLLLTGRHPAGTPASPAEAMSAILQRDPERASDVVQRDADGSGTPGRVASARATSPDALRRVLRGDLDTIVAKALKKNPAERYPSVTTLANDLRRFLRHEPIRARPDTWGYRFARFVRRHRGGVAAATLVLAAALAGTVATVAQAREARRQRDAAEAELARATAANEFLAFLMSVAAPAGRRISETDLLEKGEALVAQQFADNDALHSEMLATIGERYIIAENWDRAGRVLEEAKTLAREPGVRAHALCPLAVVKVAKGDRKGADTLMHEAFAGLPDQPQYAAQRAACLCRSAEFGYYTDEAEPMIRDSRAALAFLDAASIPSKPMRINARSTLAYGYYLARDYAKADRTYAEVMTEFERAGRAETLAAADALGNWSLVHFDTDLVKAEPICRRSVDLLRAIEGADGVTPAGLLNYAAVLFHLTHYPEAEALYDEAIRTARARSDTEVELVATSELANLHTQSGDPDRAAAELSAMERAFRTSPAFTPRRRAGYVYSLGLVAMARKDPAHALDRFRECLDRTAALDAKSNLKVLALSGSARAELALGRPSDAENHARQAVEMAESFFPKGTPSYLVAESRAILGEAQLARGDREAARTALGTAVDELTVSLGPDHPTTKRALSLREAAASTR
ncbi:MAG TPA: protein kinase [Thermoanaerobaculia bacterium]